MKNDLCDRHDLEVLLRDFYGRLLRDPAIGYVFTDVARIDLEAHLPQIVDFWEHNIFHTQTYRKNVMQVHVDLHAKESLTAAHFKTWLAHFYEATDALFEGEKAELLKTRALSISQVMRLKLG